MSSQIVTPTRIPFSERVSATNASRFEIAFFIKHAVIGQASFVVRRGYTAFLNPCSGVETIFLIGIDIADNGDDFRQSTGPIWARNFFVSRRNAGFRTQVFRWITGQRQFREQNKIASGARGFFNGGGDERRVGGQISDGGIYLGNRETHARLARHVVGQDDGLADFLHGFASVHALTLNFPKRFRFIHLA